MLAAPPGDRVRGPTRRARPAPFSGRVPGRPWEDDMSRALPYVPDYLEWDADAAEFRPVPGLAYPPSARKPLRGRLARIQRAAARLAALLRDKGGPRRPLQPEGAKDAHLQANVLLELHQA